MLDLREFLAYFEFDYKLDAKYSEDGEVVDVVFKLIDLQEDGNLGDIESEEFKDTKEIVDRMDSYYNSYLYEPFEEHFGNDVEGEWLYTKELFNLVKKEKSKDDLKEWEYQMQMMDIIFNGTELHAVGDIKTISFDVYTDLSSKVNVCEKPYTFHKTFPNDKLYFIDMSCNGMMCIDLKNLNKLVYIKNSRKDVIFRASMKTILPLDFAADLVGMKVHGLSDTCANVLKELKEIKYKHTVV